MRGPGGAVTAGVLLAAAALTKQTGVAEAAAVTVALLTGPRRRLACIAALTGITVIGVSTLALALASGGWYLYYVVRLMSEHSLDYGNFGWFWTALLTATGLAAVAALTGARRVPRELLAGCAALAVEGYVTLVHSGGSINDMLPAYLAVALLAGLALGEEPARMARGGCGRAGLRPGGFPASRLPPVPGGPHRRRPGRRRETDCGPARRSAATSRSRPTPA